MLFQSTREKSHVFLTKGLAEFKKQPGYRIAKWIIQEGFREFKNQIDWRIDFLLLLAHFLSSWMLMTLFEPVENEITRWDIYWWFYIVTASTEGYGDYYPTTLGGRLVAVTILIVGFVLLVALVIQVGQAGYKILEKLWRGEMTVKRNGHLIIVGDRGNRTKEVFRGLLEDKCRKNRELLLCFDGTKSIRNP